MTIYVSLEGDGGRSRRCPGVVEPRVLGGGAPRAGDLHPRGLRGDPRPAFERFDLESWAQTLGDLNIQRAL